MQKAKFTRTKEDFTCGHCGTQVCGNGYTNHCPQCLWSKHVDLNPGDRSAHCGALMAPTALEQKRGEWVIVLACTRCRHVRRNRAAHNDNIAAFISAQSESH